MSELKRVKVIPLKGTAEADLPKYKRPHTGLASRTRTVEAFLKREALEGFVVSLNQPESKLNLT